MNIRTKQTSKISNPPHFKLASSVLQSSQGYQQPKQNITKGNHLQVQQFNTNNKNTNYNNSIQLQLELREARSNIEFLKQTNSELLQKISFYERKFEDMRSLEQELQFRRDQQKGMQSHLDNYQQLNGKLRQRINQLENQLRNKDVNKKASRTTCQDQTSNQLSRQLSRKSYLNESSLESNRKSMGETQKQNHPLTPKSRVNINLEQFASKQMDSMHLIKERRKVFM